jgi:hypothetical protein
MAATKTGALDLRMHRDRTHHRGAHHELRGLRYVDVRCASCCQPFTVPRLPDDASNAQAEGLMCEPCAKKRDKPMSLALTKHDLKSNPPLPFDPPAD